MSESTEKLGKKVKIGGIRIKDRNQQKSQTESSLDWWDSD